MRNILLLLCLAISISPTQAEETRYCFDGIYALKENRLDDAIALYTRCIDEGELGHDNLIVAYNDRGNAYGKNKAYKQALADFNQVISLNQKDPDAWYNRGLTNKKLAAVDAAIADYTRAIELNPKYAKAYNNRGSIFGEKGQFTNAITDFNQAVTLNPGDASAFFNRGLAHYSTGNYRQAVMDLERAIELNPKYIKAYENLAWLRATCPDANLRDGIMAVSLAKKARFLRPEGTPALYDILAAAYASQGRHGQAIKYQELAIESTSEQEQQRNFQQRLDLYRNGERYEEAGLNRFLANG
jgi:tetratricopeptide (TPR) repeat protein